MEKYIYSGKSFTVQDIKQTVKIVNKNKNFTRCHISREVCRYFQWLSLNGELKARACRGFLLKLEKEGFLKLPSPQPNSKNRFLERQFKGEVLKPSKPFVGFLSEFPRAKISRIQNSRDHRDRSSLWEHLVKSYHYMGYKGVYGRYLRYLVFIDTYPVACFGWSSSAWKVKCRDDFLGVTHKERSRDLDGVVNNFRFLILPWVKIKFLGSHLLSRMIKIVEQDWKDNFNVSVELFETFVEKDRFQGTCYQASGWKNIGETKGFTRKKSGYEQTGNIKQVYICKPRK